MTDPQRSRRRGARLAALLLVGTGLAGATGTAVAAGGGAPHRWSGYAIPATGDAAGGWIGGYRVGDHELYLTTPTRRPNRAGFRPAHEVDDLAGARASRGEIQRAAWILSKYGAYREATQSAAVDASVYHLLVGGRWRIDRRLGARRIHQSGNGSAVARFARIMLRQSRRSAGAYTARIGVEATDVGGTVAVTLSVLDGHGRPAPGLPVTLGMGGESREVVTGDDGRAVARFAAHARGWHDVTATVDPVPEHLLYLRSPERRRQAAAVEGGRTRTLVVSARAAVRGPQTLSLRAAPATLSAGDPAQVVTTVSGDPAARSATATLHGPFATAGAADCTAPSVGQVASTVTSAGAYTLPAIRPAAGGYYAWRVALDGTDTNLPLVTCGAVVKVRARTGVSVTAPATAAVGNSKVTARVSGVPFPMKVDLVVKLYNTPGCTSAIGQYPLSLLGNGDVESGPIWLDPGSYWWRVEALAGELWESSESPCGAPGSTTQVSGPA